MPLAKIHVVEGRYDEARIAKVSGAVQDGTINYVAPVAETDRGTIGKHMAGH
jgi:hypothetical protein